MTTYLVGKRLEGARQGRAERTDQKKRDFTA
jgi:hypothetical protein